VCAHMGAHVCMHAHQCNHTEILTSIMEVNLSESWTLKKTLFDRHANQSQSSSVREMEHLTKIVLIKERNKLERKNVISTTGRTSVNIK